MKKAFFIVSAIAAMMMASCIKDENIEMPASSKSPIEFRSFVNKSTRADITTGNITAFRVFGFVEQASGKIFSDELVTGSGTGQDATWTYSNTQYWIPGKEYYFTAIAPAEAADRTWSFTPLAEGSGQGGKITINNNGQQDLIYAFSGVRTDSPLMYAPDKVAFTFNHLLSRVKFNFTNLMGNDLTTLTIKNVAITNANTGAEIDFENFDMTSSEWTLTGGTTTFTFGIDAPIANNDNGNTQHMYLIPQNQTYNMTFSVDVKAGDDVIATYNHEVTIPQVDMKMGHSYVFSAELNFQNINPDQELFPIEFTVSEVNDWHDNWEGAIFELGE